MTTVSTPQQIYPSLQGKSVFVSGGGTGIGACMVYHFCQQGARVTFVDIAEEASQALVAQVKKDLGVTPLYIHCDITQVESLRKAILLAGEQHGPIQVLVNNAADDTRHDVESITPEYWDDRLAINLRPVFFASQEACKQMKQAGGGSIINLGSISWRMKQTCMPAYTTAKAAIEGLTRTLAGHYGVDHIRVNTLIPGWVMTDKQRTKWVDNDVTNDIIHNQSIKALLQPEDIADAALFLASDASRMMTAQTVIVDGGWV